MTWIEDTAHIHSMRLEGEWIVINCTVDTAINVTLLLGDQEITVDDKKIKLIPWNVFNVTNLTKEDEGIFKCRVCAQEKKYKVFLTISDEGN